MKISDLDIQSILKRLSFEFEIKDGRYFVTAPSDRFDIRIKEDLIEEIGRIYGYEHIEAKRPEISERKVDNKRFIVESIIRENLVASGFSEVYTYTFQPSGELEVENALASDKSFVRNSIREQLGNALTQNIRYADLLGLSKIKIFEMGSVFTKKGEGLRLAIAVGFAKKIKGETSESEIENALKKICEIIKIENSEIHADIKDGVLEVDLEKIIDLASSELELPSFVYREKIKYAQVSSFPFSVRDVAVWALGENSQSEIEDIIKKYSGNLLKRITLFDVFSKDGKTSYAYRIVLQSMEKTLEEGEINDIMNKITEEMNAKEGWQVR